MRVIKAVVQVIRFFFTIVWGGLGILAIIGYFTQVGDDLRTRGTRSFLENTAGLLVVFVAPLTVVSVAARKFL